MGNCQCFAFLGSQEKEENASSATAATSSRLKLYHYLGDTIKRLDKSSPGNDELKKIEPSVCNSIRQMCAGAPKEQRDKFHAALVSHRVLPGFEATKAEFRAALTQCIALIGDPPVHAGLKPSSNDPEPTDEELKTFNGVLARLWELEEPRRLVPETGYRLNHGGRAGFDSSADESADPLFSFVDQHKLMKNSCTRAFIALLDNYTLEDDQAEKVTQEEKNEMDMFMHSLMMTPHMRYVHKVLQKWRPDDISIDPEEFSAQVYHIWFTNFGIGRGPACSSGFEHVFVGELDVEKGAIAGMHNWIQFWNQEKKGKLNYKGFCGAITKEDTRLVSVRFGCSGEDKDVSTFLVGTSVAFDFALYTLAYLSYPDGKCDQGGLYLGENVGPIRITTYPWNIHGFNVIRSAFIRHG